MQKIKALIYGFHPSDETKDVGQIPIELSKMGYDVSLITLNKKLLDNYRSPLPMIKIGTKFEALNFIEPDDIVFIHSFSSVNSSILNGIKNKGSKILLKLDSDGRMGKWHKPKARFYMLRSFRKPLWKIPIRPLIYTTPIGIFYEQEEIERLNLADAIVVESYPAMRNIYQFLMKHNRLDLASKIYMIPDPVTPDILASEISEKKNFVVSIGRWDDKIQKNPKVLIKTLSNFLKIKKEWESIIIGNGTDILKGYVEKFMEREEVKRRIHVIGTVSHPKIKEYLSKSKILFMPSRFESFGIAAAEALCNGCSIVSTPIEPLEFMCAGGLSGTTSLGFDSKSLLSGLLTESGFWEKGSFPQTV